MYDYRQIKALFVDIDDTVIRVRPGASTSSLFDVLERAGVELGGLSAQEASRRIANVRDETLWWHWSDFIVALNLRPKEFWSFAYEMESEYLVPTGAEMRGALQRIKSAGRLLYVTSNNPSSGILHKLSLAGLGSINGAPLFDQLLGASELHAMKWEPAYWKKALAHTGLDAEEVAIVGDHARDDLEIPQSVGIPHTFLIDRQRDVPVQNSENVTHVSDFEQIADCLLLGKGARRVNGTGTR